MVLKELIFNSFYFGRGVVVLKALISTVSTLGGCGSLERTEFLYFLILRGCGALQIAEF